MAYVVNWLVSALVVVAFLFSLIYRPRSSVMYQNMVAYDFLVGDAELHFTRHISI